MYLSLP